MALPIAQPMTQQQTFQQPGTLVQPNFMYSNSAFPAFGPQLQPQFSLSPLQQQLFQKQQELQQLQQQLQHEVQQAELQQLQCQIQQTQQLLLKQQQQRQRLQQQLPQPHGQQRQIQQRQSLQPSRPAFPVLPVPPILPVLPVSPPKPPQPRRIQGPPPISKNAARLSGQRISATPTHSNRNRYTICSPSTSQSHSLQVSPRTTSVLSSNAGLSRNAAQSSSATPTREMQRLSLASRRSFHSLQHRRLLSPTAPLYHHLNAAAASSTTALLDSNNVKTRPPPVPTIPKHHHSNAGVSRTTALMDSKNVKTPAGPILTTPKNHYLKLAASNNSAFVSSKNATTRAGPIPTIPDHHNPKFATSSPSALEKPKTVTIVTGPTPSRYRRREVQPNIPQKAGIDPPQPVQSPRPSSVLKKFKSMDLMRTRKDKSAPSVAAKDRRAWRMSGRFDGVLGSRLGSSGREAQPLDNEALQSSLIKKPHTTRAPGLCKLVSLLKPKTEATSDSSSSASIEATTGSDTTDSTPPSSIMTCEGKKKIPKSIFE